VFILLRKTEKLGAKNQSSKTLRMIQSLNKKGNQPYQPEEGKNLGRYEEKRERQGRGAGLGLNNNYM
jgi:hypothetical protein